MSRKAIEMEGKKFGKLLVIRYAGSRRQQKDKLWECKCDCGNLTIVPTTRLLHGVTKSCGCYRTESRHKRLKPDRLEHLKHSLFRKLKAVAKRSKISWTLSRTEFDNLIQQSCFYCGGQPSNASKDVNGVKLSDTVLYYNGLDKIDPNGGYTLSNVVPCCIVCNKMKSNHSLDNFLFHINKIYGNTKITTNIKFMTF